MLFRRNIAPGCGYCKHGVSIGFSEVVCIKRGIMDEDGMCTAFRYEPTKRKPDYARKLVLAKIGEEEMSI